MEKEIWKDIEGFEGRYQVSNLGNVKSLNYGNHGYAKNLVPKVNNQGYKWVELIKGETKKCLLIHRLVALAFVSNPNNYPIINHKDENPLNCKAENLEWCTVGYNNKYSRDRHPERFIKQIKRKRKKNKARVYTKRGAYKPKNIFIAQLTMNKNIIRIWNDYAEIRRVLNYNGTSLKECCEGKRKTAYGYKWEFAEQSVDSLFI